MRAQLHRLICWSIERVVAFEVIGGLRLYDLRYREDSVPAELLAAATDYLDRADERFGTLVREEIRMVVASAFQDSIYPAPRAYFTRLRGLEATSPLFLASRLVWVAACLRGVAASPAGTAARESLERTCTREQVAFLDSIGTHAGWIESLRQRIHDPKG